MEYVDFFDFWFVIEVFGSWFLGSNILAPFVPSPSSKIVLLFFEYGCDGDYKLSV